MIQPVTFPEKTVPRQASSNRSSSHSSGTHKRGPVEMAKESVSRSRRSRPRTLENCLDPDPSDPTLEEIAQICLEIQETWSPREKERRRKTIPTDDYQPEPLQLETSPKGAKNWGNRLFDQWDSRTNREE